LSAFVSENALINLGHSGDHASEDLIVLGQDNPFARG
jgi:hypothetical protein